MSNFRLLSVNGVWPLWAVLLPTFPPSILECYLSSTSTSSDMWIKHCRESAHSRKSHQSANTRHTCRAAHTHTHIHKHTCTLREMGAHTDTWRELEGDRVKERETLPFRHTYTDPRWDIPSWHQCEQRGQNRPDWMLDDSFTYSTSVSSLF